MNPSQHQPPVSRVPHYAQRDGKGNIAIGLLLVFHLDEETVTKRIKVYVPPGEDVLACLPRAIVERAHSIFGEAAIYKSRDTLHTSPAETVDEVLDWVKNLNNRKFLYERHT